MITSTEIIMNLQDIRDFNGSEEIDVRLQVLDDGGWAVHSGQACYDTDHHGAWGASIMDGESDLTEIAEDLIEQVKEQIADDEG